MGVIGRREGLGRVSDRRGRVKSDGMYGIEGKEWTPVTDKQTLTI